MGIHDRDYARPARSSGSFGPLGGVGGGGLTVVHWLVIINVAVFMLDIVMPQIQVTLGRQFGDNVDRSIPMSVVKGSPQQVQPGIFAYPIVQIPPGGTRPELVGYEQYMPMPMLQGIGHFSTLKAFTHLELWRFITYQFLHANISHLVFNMLGLVVFGPGVVRHLGSSKLFLSFYLACGIFGAFLYLILNLLGWQFGAVPGLLITQPWVPLVGASAAIFGVLMASAKVAKDDMLMVLFVIPMKTWVAAYAFFAIAVGNLIFSGHNAGGDAAHVGGAIAGFILIRKPELLLDFFDDFLRAPRSDAPRRRRGGAASKVDRILDKVAREGMGSLSSREKRTLERAAKSGRSV